MDFATSMRPDFHRAVIDTISHYGWKNIIYLYHTHEGKQLIPSSDSLQPHKRLGLYTSYALQYCKLEVEQLLVISFQSNVISR